MPYMQLKNISLLKVELSVNEDFEAPDKDLNFQVGISMDPQYDKEKLLLDLMLCVKVTGTDGDPLPFNLEIAYSGSFSFDKDADEKTIEMLGKINCPAIIFPYIREHSAELTRKAGFPPLLLPVINFVKMAKDIEKDEKKARKKKAPKN